MKKIKATVGILTFNSEKTLRRTLESVKSFEELVICDGGSTDKTLDIAGEYNCKIISQDSKCKNSDNTMKDFSCAKNQCLRATKHDWYVALDSDESLSKGLLREIRSIVEKNKQRHVFRVPVRIFIDDREIKYSSNYPGYQIRFFNKKSGVRFIKPVHERVVFDVSNKTGITKNPWLVHWTRKDAKNYFKNNKKYIRLEVERHRGESFGRYLKISLFGNVLIIMKIFVKSLINYIFHGFKKSMPIYVEWGRIRYIIGLIYCTTVSRLRP